MRHRRFSELYRAKVLRMAMYVGGGLMVLAGIAFTDELPVPPVESSALIDTTRSSSLNSFRTYPLLDRANRALLSGDLDRARSYLDRALDVDSEDPSIWVASGGVELRRGDLNRANADFSQAIALDGARASAYLYRGMAYLQEGELRSGLLDIAQSLHLDTLKPAEADLAQRTVSQLGYERERLLQRVSRDPFANLRTVMGSLPSDRRYERLLAESELPVDLHLQRVQLAHELGFFQEALEDARALKASGPGGRTLEALYDVMAVALSDANDHRRALALHLDRLAHHRMSSVQLERAIEDASLAGDEIALQRFLEARLKTASGKRRVDLLFARADSHIGQGDLGLAAARLREIATDRQVDPTDKAIAWRNMGRMAQVSGDALQAWIGYGKAARFSDSIDDVNRMRSLERSPDVMAYVRRRAEVAFRAERRLERSKRLAEQESIQHAREALKVRFEAGECGAALEALEREPDQAVAEPALYMNAAECFHRAGQRQEAMPLYQRALDMPVAMSLDRQIYARSSLAHGFEAAHDYVSASDAWATVAELDGTATSRLNAAYAARQADQIDSALSHIQRIDPTSLRRDQDRMRYHDVASAVYENSNPARAIDQAVRSLALRESSYQRRRIAAIALSQGNHRLAVEHLLKAVELEPEDHESWMALGYAQIELGDAAAAADTFEALVARFPEDPEATLQHAYLLKTRGQSRAAAETFRRHVDLRSSVDAAHRSVSVASLYDVRTEIRALEKHTYFNGTAATERATSGNATGLRAGNGDDSLFLEAGWEPRGFERITGRKLALFTRLIGNMNDRIGQIDDDSGRVGIGARLQPFPTVGVYLQAERRLGLSESANDLTQLTTAFQWSRGLDFTPNVSSWNQSSFYSDVAYSMGESNTRSAFAQGLYGRAFRVGPHATVTPHIVAASQYSDDSSSSRRVVDAGLGISSRVWMGADRYRTSGGHLDFSLQYRSFVVNSESDASGEVVARASFAF